MRPLLREGAKQLVPARLQNDTLPCRLDTYSQQLDILEGPGTGAGDKSLRDDAFATLCALSAHRHSLVQDLAEQNAVLLERIRVLETEDHSGIQRESTAIISGHSTPATSPEFRRTSSCPPVLSSPEKRPRRRQAELHGMHEDGSQSLSQRANMAALRLAELAMHMVEMHEAGSRGKDDHGLDTDSLINVIDRNVTLLENDVLSLVRHASLEFVHLSAARVDHDSESEAFLARAATKAELGGQESSRASVRPDIMRTGRRGPFQVDDNDPVALTCRFALVVTIVVAMIMFLVIFLLTVEHRKTMEFVLWVCALSPLSISIPVSGYDMFMHLYHSRSRLQVHYASIMALAPIHGMQALLVIRFVWARKWLIFMREMYETLALYLFFRLLTQYLYKRRDIRFGEQVVLSSQILPDAEHGDGQSAFATPLTALRDPRRPSSIESKLFPTVKAGLYQYLATRMVFSIAVLFVQCVPMQDGDLHDSNSRFVDPGRIDSLYFWEAMSVNVSQQLAFSMLAVFITALKRPLRDLHPWSKLAAVCILIFCPVWQKWCFAFAVYWGVIVPPVWGNRDPAALENFVLCFECAVLTFLLRRVFSHFEFLDGGSLYAITDNPSGWTAVAHETELPTAVSGSASIEGEEVYLARVRLESELVQLQSRVAEKIRALEELKKPRIDPFGDDTDESEDDVPFLQVGNLPRNVSGTSLLSSSSLERPSLAATSRTSMSRNTIRREPAECTDNGEGTICDC